MKKWRLKALAAALSFAFAAPAGAAIDLSTTGNGELFFSIWDSVSQTSYTRDLGVSFNEFATGNVAGGSLGTTAPGYSLTFGPDGTLTSWLGGLVNPSLQWNVAAMDGSGQNRYLTTALGAAVAPATTTQLNTWNDNPDVYIANVNSGPWVTGSHVPTDGSSAIDVAANPNGYAGAASWSNTWAGKAAFNNAGGLGGSLLFYLLYGAASGGLPPGLDQFDNAFGASTWTLAGDGTLTFMSPAGAEVPLPGAVWLLASGLLGLAAIARRRREGDVAKLATA
jgi:hypothetical protein